MTSPSNDVHGIIFDMDGVLCDSEAFMAEAGCAMFRQVHGVEVVPGDFHPFSGMGEDRYLGGVANRYGVTLTMPRDKIRAYELYLDIVRGRLQPLPGCREFIASCRKRGLKLAVASSADWMKVVGNLRELGLPPSQFDAVVSGSDVQHKKPHPEIFLKAAALIGLEPRQCVVVEDAVSGVTAAQAAGCRCLGLTTSLDAETLRKAGATWIAADLSRVSPADLV
jgi:HAD superfamily hydrolase (TIGR01509 family)